MKQSTIFAILFVAMLLGLIGGMAGGIFTLWMRSNDDRALIADFYATENAVHVSPHSLRGKMDKGINDYVLVDLRSPQEYEKEHIVGAINIPAYSDPSTPAYDQVERIVGQFSALGDSKPIIVYCYSMPCMTGRKIGKMLAEHGIYVQHLGIGWNEWRHHWTLWNHELEWKETKAEDYVVSGSKPGTPKKRTPKVITPCLEGEFGC